MQTVPADVMSRVRGWGYAVHTLANYHLYRHALRFGYYEYKFRRKCGHAPDYACPRRLSDKLAWMRLNDRNPLYPRLVDKIAVRDYVRERVGDEVLIPLYGVWEQAADVPFDALPDRFALKCNHESGFVVLCHDRAQLDRHYVRAQLATRLRMNYYYKWLEWPYLNVPPRILAEELLRDEQGGEPIDYKFYCFHGAPGYIFTVKNRHHQPIRAYYSPDWERLPFTSPRYDDHAELLPRPPRLDRMLEIAVALARGLRFCRVDLYAIGPRVYFGELTIIAGAGFLRYVPDSYDAYWGDLLTLPGEEIPSTNSGCP